MKRTYGIALCVLSLTVFACGSKKAAEEKAETQIMELAETADATQIEGPSEKPNYEIKEGQSVAFGNIKDGDVLSSPFTMEMVVNGMELQPKGKAIEGQGHHHLIVNGTFVEMGEIVPASETSIHYGDGGSSKEVTLAPGSYSLTIQFADGLHQSYGEKMSATIQVEVK